MSTVPSLRKLARLGMPFNNGELIDHQPVVLLRVGEIHQPDLVAHDAPLFVPVLDVHTLGEHLVELTVVGHEAGAIRTDNLPESILQSLSRYIRVQSSQGRAQPLYQHHITVASPLRVQAIAGDVRASEVLIAKALEPVNGGFFYYRLSYTCHGSLSLTTSAIGFS